MSPAPAPELRPNIPRRPQLNNSDSGLFTVFTGVKNLSRIHMVDKWNGMSQVRRGCPAGDLTRCPLGHSPFLLRVLHDGSNSGARIWALGVLTLPATLLWS